MLQRFRELCILPDSINITDIGSFSPLEIIHATQQLARRNSPNEVMWHSSCDMTEMFRMLTIGEYTEEFAIIYYRDNYIQVLRSSLENVAQQQFIRDLVTSGDCVNECMICSNTQTKFLVYCQYCAMCCCVNCIAEEGHCPSCEKKAFTVRYEN